jgi:VWFA-related protein
MRKGHPTRVLGADRGRRRRSALGLLALVICLGLLAGGRETAAYPQQQQAVNKPLQYEVSVVLKLIHVYVTDKKGNPVPDLTASDFIVTDNGQPMTVTDFERRMLQAAADANRPTAPQPEIKTETVSAPIPAARPSARKYFLFFDLEFNNLRGATKAKEAALHFLDTQVGAGDEVGLITYSIFGGIKVHEFLTTDHGKVREALLGLTQKGSFGRAEEMEDRYWRLIQEWAGPDPKAQVDHGSPSSVADANPKTPDYINEARAQRAEGKRLTRTYVESLTALAKSLRYVPGQKQFILFSSGVPNSLIYGAQAGNPSMTTAFGGGSQFDTGDSTLRAMNESMYKEFAVSGCTFYSFDTRESSKGADLFGWDDRTGVTGSHLSVLSQQSLFQDSSNLFKDDKLTGRDFLKRLSDVTGGEYFSNINRYEKNLDQVQSLTGTYYVLGFPINERWDGKYHEVKVEVRRKGCEVRAQAGYFNPKPFSEYTDLEKQLHLFDLALNERALSRMPDSVPMCALTSTAEGISRLAVLAKVPGETTAKFSGRKLEFVAIFFDAKGEISDMVREELDPASFRSRDITFAAGSSLKPGDYICRLVIRDMDSGTSAVGSAKATILKPQITGLQLGTPLVLEPLTGCPLISAGAKKAKAAFPWSEIYPYDSSLFSPILGELPPAAESIQVVIPCAIPGAGQSELTVSASLVKAGSGERSPLTVARMDRAPKGPLEILTLELPTAGIPAGTYYLHFYAQDRATGSLGHAFTTLVVAHR